MDTILEAFLFSASVAISGVLIGEYYSYKRLQHEKKAKIIGWLHHLNTGHYTHLVQCAFGLNEWLMRLKSSKGDDDLLHALYMIARYTSRVKKLVEVTGGIYLLGSIKSSDILSRVSKTIRSELVECTGDKLDELPDIDKLNIRTLHEFKKHLESSGLTPHLFESLRRYPKRRIEKLTKRLRLYYELLDFEIYSLYQPLYGKEIQDQLIGREQLHKLAEYNLNLENLEKYMLTSRRKLTENIEVLEKSVGEGHERGSKDNEYCEVASALPISAFEKISARVLNRFLVSSASVPKSRGKLEFPLLIRVKKTREQVGAQQVFRYSTKYKNVKNALTMSQCQKNKIDHKLKELYNIQVEKYGSTRKKLAMISSAFAILLLSIYLTDHQEVVSGFLYTSGIYLLGTVFAALGVFLLLKGISFSRTKKIRQ